MWRLKMKKVNQRLKRLISSDICKADNAEVYREELVNLANDVGNLKDLKKQSKLFKALSDMNRLKILKLLKLRDMCICELMIALQMSQPNLSHHVGILENNDLINRIKRGKWVYCSLVDNEVIKNI